MRKALLLSLLFVMGFVPAAVWGQGMPELLYYKFDGSGTSVPNEATSPPAGTTTATIGGAMSQGSNGQCGGALIGTGGSSTTDFCSTNWATNISSAWTISFWSSNVISTTTLYYIFGDNTAGLFRCFTGGVAGAGNWILRGPVTDVLVTGGASMTPSVTTFVYDPTLGNIKAYLNGVLVNTVAQAPITLSGTGPFTVGSYNGSAGMPAGMLMDEFRFYNRALDAAEVLLVYNQCLPLSNAPNDASAYSLIEPLNFCADTQDIVINIRNYGSTQLDSCIVNWEFDGVPQSPYYWYGALDTFGGTGPIYDTITLGSQYFATGSTYSLKAWTSLPNGQADTVNWNDTLNMNLQASLAGTFSIGGPGADFANFSAAAAVLNSVGVCGPVIFEVYDTTYNEQFTLMGIAGTSSTNTILFRPMSGMPVVSFNSTGSTDNYVLSMAGCAWVTFEGIRFTQPAGFYSTVLDVRGNAHDNSFIGCEFISPTASSTSTLYAIIYSNTDVDYNFLFEDNLISGGSYSTYWYGSSTTTLEPNNVWRGNRFMDFYYMGCRTYYQDSPTYESNYLSTNTFYTGTSYGFYFGYNDNAMRFYGNEISSSNGAPRYGCYFTLCDGQFGNESLIANNMIHVGGSGYANAVYGTYLTSVNYTKFYHNSIYAEGTSTASRATYFSGGNNEALNNNAVAESGYAIYYGGTTALSASDYNNWKSYGTNVGYYSATSYPDLASLSLATSQDMNSVSRNPMFISSDDLHVCADSLNGLGTPLSAFVPDDIDGQMRNTTNPDLGADEVEPLPLAGFLGPDSTFACGDSMMIDLSYVSPTDTILWSDGSIDPIRWLQNAGVYSVSISGPCGSTTDTLEIFTTPLVYSGFLMADTTLACEGDTIFLSTSSPYSTYAWSNGDTASSTGVTSSGTYFVDVTDGCGSGNDSVMVNFLAQAVAGFSSSSNNDTCFFVNASTGGGTLSYAWTFGDGGTSTAADPNHIYASSGAYLVTLTVTNECGSASFSDTCNVVIVANGVGLDFQVVVHPNPADKVVKLSASLPSSSDVKLSLLNLTGQQMASKELGAVSGKIEHQFNVQDFPAGIYILQIEADGYRQQQKLVIEH